MFGPWSNKYLIYSNLYLFIFSNMRFFKWSWYSLTAVVWQNLSTVDLARSIAGLMSFPRALGSQTPECFSGCLERKCHTVSQREACEDSNGPGPGY